MYRDWEIRLKEVNMEKHDISLRLTTENGEEVEMDLKTHANGLHVVHGLEPAVENLYENNAEDDGECEACTI